ncbi:hypothetical protein [Pseudomonas sp.]|uniref:hypothetical protein n=1 Tax=Pseudomonas sp. TaxID=306 RepID=UPI003A97A4A9
MTALDSASPILELILIGGFVPLGIVSFVYSQILASRHLDQMIHALQSSQQIKTWALHSKGGASRYLLLCMIGGTLLSAKYLSQKGYLDKSEADKFDPSLKRKLYTLLIMVAGTFAWAAIICVINSQ